VYVAIKLSFVGRKMSNVKCRVLNNLSLSYITLSVVNVFRIVTYSTLLVESFVNNFVIYHIYSHVTKT